jgi:hypothetical protein
MMQSYNIYQALIGAFQSQDRRYIEYVDGSLMTDGFFSDVSGKFFGKLYSTNQNGSTYLMIKPDGNIYPCYGGFPLCEKSLIKDLTMCIDSKNLQTNMNVNTSSSINIWSHNSAAICIEYCRGWSDQSYAVLNTKACTCGTNVMFDSNILESANGIKRPLSSCLNSRSYSKLGNDVGNGKTLTSHFQI